MLFLYYIFLSTNMYTKVIITPVLLNFIMKPQKKRTPLMGNPLKLCYFILLFITNFYYLVPNILSPQSPNPG